MTEDRTQIVSLDSNSLPVGVCIIREDYTISLWNRTLEVWTGISNQEALSRRLDEVAPHFSNNHEKARLRVVFQGGGPVVFSSRFHPRMFPLSDERQIEGRYQRITISPYYRPEGEFQALIAVEDVTAITRQVLLYRHLKDKLACELEEKTRTEAALEMALSKLNNLASITRHDLNNSLTVFLGYLEMILGMNKDGKIQTYLEKMKESARDMKRHISFARDYQEMGTTLPRWYVVESLVSAAAVDQLFHDITIVTDLKNLEILADPLIFKVFYNLFENAVRHGEHTSVITVSGRETPNDCIITIEDDGKGIPSAVKGRIFNKGYGTNTGLGLFFTREILGITGMQIIETGTAGKGSRFEIRVPPGHFRYSDKK